MRIHKRSPWERETPPLRAAFAAAMVVGIFTAPSVAEANTLLRRARHSMAKGALLWKAARRAGEEKKATSATFSEAHSVLAAQPGGITLMDLDHCFLQQTERMGNALRLLGKKHDIKELAKNPYRYGELPDIRGNALQRFLAAHKLDRSDLPSMDQMTTEYKQLFISYLPPHNRTKVRERGLLGMLKKARHPVATDRPNPGAVRYVNWLLQKNPGKVAFLTGRLETVKGETQRMLIRARADPSIPIYCKPSRKTKDADWKQTAIEQIEGDLSGKIRVLFDDQLANLQQVKASRPNAHMVQVKLPWLRLHEPDEQIFQPDGVIRSF